MILTKISIKNLRNLINTDLTFHPKLNVFVGLNGSGKTSILEAIYFLAVGRSFRASRTTNLININQQLVCISGNYINKSLTKNIKIAVCKALNQDKCSKIGGMAATGAQIAALTPAQMINDETSKLIFKEPEIRRKFLDWLVFYANHNYYLLWKDFNRVLLQRNKLLKNYNSNAIRILIQLDNVFTDLSLEITKAREKVWKAFLPVWHATIADLNLEPCIDIALHLEPGWKGDLQKSLEIKRDVDLKLGLTSVGPHKADLNFSIAGKPAKEFLSRGQGKILSLGLILARAKFITQLHDNKDLVSLLLIDDLCAELDEPNTSKIISALLHVLEDVQLFITGTDSIKLKNALSGTTGEWFGVSQGSIFGYEQFGA